ncbi:MAG: alpha/beta fold hydrolase [Steroidobacteraceae bacterium]
MQKFVRNPLPSCFAIVLAFAGMPWSCGARAADGADRCLSPLVDREMYSESAQRENARVSPGGRYVASLRTGEHGAEILLAPRSDLRRERSLLARPMAGIQQFEFTPDERDVLLLADRDGDEQYRLYVADIATGTLRALTPAGAQVSIERIGRPPGRRVVVSMNDRDPDYLDLVSIDLDSGEQTRVFRNDRYSAFVVGPDLAPVMASRLETDGGKTWYRLHDGTATVFRQLAPADTVGSGLGEVSADGRSIAFLDSSGRDHVAARTLDLHSGRESVVGDETADVSGYLADPVNGAIMAVEYDDLVPHWVPLAAGAKRALGSIGSEAPGERMRVTSRSADDSVWVVTVSGPTRPGSTYVYDRTADRLTPWYTDYPGIGRDVLAPMQARRVRSRDGLDLPVFYTLPRTAPGCDGAATAPRRPAVVWVHGGPWDRDRWDFRLDHQLLANRGYAVVSVDFRGSTGFGKAFVSAGDHEWGRRMQDDLADAVDALAAEGIIDRSRVAVVGSSYGGYAALAALAFTPTKYACGVSVVGPSDLVSLIEGIPPYWTATRSLYTSRVGDPATEAGRALLESRSPLRAAADVKRPLLIVHGANDPRVPEQESRRMAEAVVAAGGQASLLLFPDEGHGISRPGNARALTAVVEAFLQRCLGGRAQPVGTALDGSTLQIPVGREFVVTLDPALR